VLILLSSWRWAQSCSKHVEYSNKHIIEEIVRQIGHLPEKKHRVELCYNVIKGQKYFCALMTEEYNIMVECNELIGNTE
jgi:hypothetical protein